MVSSGRCQGNTLLNNGREIGPQENLLYLLVVWPELAATGHGTGTDYGRGYNSYISRWETAKGDVSVTVTWDKRTDKVSIGGQQFDRGLGSTFVIVRQPEGMLKVTQLPSPGPDSESQAALDFIQKRMINDATVRSVRLPTR